MKDLDQFIADALPLLPKEDAEQPTRFFRAAVDYARRWYKYHDERGTLTAELAAFIFSEAPRTECPADAQQLRQIASDLSIALGGNVLLVGENLREGHMFRQAAANTQSFYAAIDGYGWGSRLCVILNPDQRDVTVCFDGVNGSASSTFSVIEAPLRDWSEEEFLASLAQFHELYTFTPLSAAHPWLDTATRIPLPKCELRIQSLLVLYLMYAVLHTNNIIAEHGTELGRVDIHVQTPGLGVPFKSCIIELKVLRSRFPPAGATRWYAKQNLDHARDGVQQAVAYRHATKAGLAILCCFDARDKDDELEGFPAYPESVNVKYRRYYMHSNVPDAQAAVLAQFQKNDEATEQPG
ncbi:MAG: hypothetical protein JWP08_1493 [Bryobacterales bacterium]|nr:hypothetical protein [Bryobacterales bacterium]